MKPYIHRVQYYETDRMGITHHSNYIRWMEEARVAFLEEIGWGYDRLEAEGVVSPGLSVDGHFQKRTTFGDEVEITAMLKEYRGIRIVLEYEMKNWATGETVFVGTSEHCFLDGNGRPARLKSVLPEFDKKLKELVI